MSPTREEEVRLVSEKLADAVADSMEAALERIGQSAQASLAACARDMRAGIDELCWAFDYGAHRLREQLDMKESIRRHPASFFFLAVGGGVLLSRIVSRR